METDILELKREVFFRRPVLKEILDKHGELPLKTYVQIWPVPKKADGVFLKALKEVCRHIHGGEAADKLVLQLKAKPLISTVDHLGIWNHPIFVNSDLIFSLHFGNKEIMPVLATESVTLNNTSSWSASLIWHEGSTASDAIIKRASFLPDKVKTLPVFSAPSISKHNLNQFEKKTKGKLKDVVNILKLEPGEKFPVQACRASYNLWHKVFPSAPKLVYLPLETIVLKYVEKILSETKNSITKIITTKEGRTLWSKYFAGEHTFMFWQIDGKGKRQRLKSFDYNTKEILGLIAKRKVYPSSPLCFIVLLKAGLACAGGFTQTTWLTEVKEKFAHLLSELGDDSLKIKNLPTQNFCESLLAQMEMTDQLVSPSGTDLYLAGKDLYSHFVKSAEDLSLQESFRLALPTIYSVVVPKTEWVRGFSSPN